MVRVLPANAANARDVGLIPGSERCPGVGKWKPAPVFLPVFSTMEDFIVRGA